MKRFIEQVAEAVQQIMKGKQTDGYYVPQVTGAARLNAKFGTKPRGVALYVSDVTSADFKLELPAFCSDRGFKIIGKSGSGKTALVRQFLENIEQAQEAAVIYGSCGLACSISQEEALDLTTSPAPSILSLVGWTVFNDVRTVKDAEAIARALTAHLEKPNGVGNFWRLEVQRLITAVIEVVPLRERTPLNRHVAEIMGQELADLSVILGLNLCNVFPLSSDPAHQKGLNRVLEAARECVKPLATLQDGPLSISYFVADPQVRVNTINEGG